MSSSRLGGYQRSRTTDSGVDLHEDHDGDQHPGTDNYPAGEPSEYRGIGSSSRPRISSAYIPEYKSSPEYRSSVDSDLDANYGGGFDSGRYARSDFRDSDGGGSDYDEDYDDWDYDEPDRRWRWVAIAAGVVLLVAVLITVLVVNGGDDTQTATAGDDTAAPRTVIATAPSATNDVVPTPSPQPSNTLPPETVTTVTPAPPPVEPTDVAPPVEAAPPAAPAPGTITYSVTGSRQLFDLVSIIYTDEQGLPRTDVNVALPWTRTLVLNPGVTTMSVTATSVSGQLNCSITDAAGAVVLAQNNNMMISTCTM